MIWGFKLVFGFGPELFGPFTTLNTQQVLALETGLYRYDE